MELALWFRGAVLPYFDRRQPGFFEDNGILLGKRYIIKL
jgi:hypothetical protein